jgi:molecular chaperone GrpE
MKFKNIFKNKGNMTTENTEIDKEMDVNIQHQQE